jgi:flavin reductase ActVB
VHRKTVAVDPDSFREALSHWASGVAVAAVREEGPEEGPDAGKVHATTMTAFLSVSLQPPLVLLSLGPGAQILPFLTVGKAFGVSVLGEEQARIASVFADSYPVGESPFPVGGDPLIPDAPVRLSCRVHRTDEAGDHRLVLALVESAEVDEGAPLIRYRRGYRRLAED